MISGANRRLCSPRGFGRRVFFRWRVAVVGTALALMPLHPVGAVAHAQETELAGTVRSGSQEIAYVALGEGPLVVIVHGGPGMDHSYLRPWLDGIGEYALAVYYDQRGTGGSTGPLDASTVNLEAFVADIDAVRTAFERDHFIVLGHSWGGLLAAAYALRYPERLDGLILTRPSGPGHRYAAATAGNQLRSRTPDEIVRIRELAASDAFAQGDTAVASEVYRLAFRGTLADPADLAKLDLAIAERTARNAPKITELLGKTMEAPDWWEELAGLKVPALVVHGRHDPVPAAMAEELARTISGAELLILPDAGHFPFAETPDEVLAAIRRFVSDHGSLPEHPFWR